MTLELIIEGEEGEPTAEERAAVELVWMKGGLLPFPWVIAELPAGPTDTGVQIPPGTFVMVKAPAVWARRYAEEMHLDPSRRE
jgi:hypothetical protein